MLRRYIAWLYLKSFFIIFSALVVLFTGIDFLQSIKKLPDSASLKILYLSFQTFYGVEFLLGISLVFAMILTKVKLIKSSELVVLYALGYSKRDILKPFIYIALTITLILIALYNTPLAYAKDYASSIKKKMFYQNSTTNLFFKFNNLYIYFEELSPFTKEAFNVRVFEIKNEIVRTLIVSDKATFNHNAWHLQNPTIVELSGNTIQRLKGENTNILDGFRPKILENIFEGKKEFTILDAIDSIALLRNQNLNTNKIESILYKMVIFPFFALAFIVILFLFVPISTRYANLALFSFLALLTSLVAWGGLLALSNLAISGVLSASVAILLPIALLMGLSGYIFWKKI